MEHISFGWITLVLTFAFPALYLSRHFLRVVFTTEQTTERVGRFAVLLVVVGFTVGLFAQSLVDEIRACKQRGELFATCFLVKN